MAVLQRIRLVSAERFDLTDALNLSAFANADWAAWIDNAITGLSEPLIVSGFTIPDPDTIVTQVVSTVSITIDGSVLMHPSSTGGAGGFYIAAPGTDAQEVSLTAGQTNFIEVDQATSTGATDTRAIWDEAGGADGTGEEFSQAIDTVTNLDVIVTVNTVGFTAGKVPIAKVVVDANGTVDSITDSRNLYFRLGTGGTTPDPNFQFGWSEGRTDHGVTLTTADPTDNPFTGSDKVITTEKQWKNAVMSRLAELQGPGAKWFEGGSTGSGSLSDIYMDAVGSVVTSKNGTGTFAWNSGTNTLTWNADLEIRTFAGPYFFTIPAGSVSITAGDVAYLEQLRNLPFPTSSDTLAWTNGATFVDGDPGGGSFDGLESDTTSAAGRGDWIKKTTDNIHRYVRILDFYDAAGGAAGPGALTTAALAVSVELVQAYDGTTGNAIGTYAKGAYTLTSAAAENVAFNTNNWWLASRWGTPTGKLYVRDMGEFENGEEREVGDNTSTDVLTYIGSAGETDNDPNYTGQITGAVTAPNWETTNGESLTTRAGKLTGAAAGASQDKNLVLIRKQPSTLADNFVWNGTDLLWEGLYLQATGDDELRNAVTNQTSTSGGLTDLADGECIHVTFLRNAGGPTSLAVTQATVSSLDPTTLNDQIVILARRIGTRVYDYLGNEVKGRDPFITIGDGVNSRGDYNGTDKIPFTDAIASLPSTGGTIYVKRGTYTFASTLAISKTNVRLIGEGPNTAKITAALASDPVIEISVDGVELESLQVENSGGPGVSSVIEFTSAADNCRVHKCRLINSFVGSATDGSDNFVIDLDGNQNSITDNVIEHDGSPTGVTRVAIYLAISSSSGTVSSKYNRIERNRFALTSSAVNHYGIHFLATRTSTGIVEIEYNTISNNIFEGTTDLDFVLQTVGTASLSVRFNTIVGNRFSSGIVFDQDNAGTFIHENAMMSNFGGVPTYTNVDANVNSYSWGTLGDLWVSSASGAFTAVPVDDEFFNQFT